MAFLLTSSLFSASEEVITIYGSNLSFAPSDWNVVCYGAACKGSADSVQAAIDEMLRRAVKDFVEEEEIAASFCAALKSSEPSHCESKFGGHNSMSLLYKHSSVWWDFPSATNGCGTGSFFESALSSRLTGTNGFTGDLDEPISGFSFEPACNNHDMCYNGGTGRNGCDGSFYTELQSICSGSHECNDFAKLYSAIVDVFGQEAYNEAALVQECRDFKNDIAKNRCVNMQVAGTGNT
ncbi:MAG: phospholipase [Thalassotalea sp.]|nr:phospholipase [Thalassotalea sp.]